MSGTNSREQVARIVESFLKQMNEFVPNWRVEKTRGYTLIVHASDNRFIRLEFFRLLGAGVRVVYGLTYGSYPVGHVDLDYPIPKKLKRPYILVTETILGIETDLALEFNPGSSESMEKFVNVVVPEYFDQVSKPCLEKLKAVAKRIATSQSVAGKPNVQKDADALLSKTAIATLKTEVIPVEREGDIERFAAFLRKRREVLAKSAYAATVKYMQSLPDICRDPDINDYLGREVPLKDLVALRNAVVAPLGDGFEFVLVYDCEWDPEHGFSILFRGEKAVEASLELDADLTYRVASRGKNV